MGARAAQRGAYPLWRGADEVGHRGIQIRHDAAVAKLDGRPQPQHVLPRDLQTGARYKSIVWVRARFFLILRMDVRRKIAYPREADDAATQVRGRGALWRRTRGCRRRCRCGLRRRCHGSARVGPTSSAAAAAANGPRFWRPAMATGSGLVRGTVVPAYSFWVVQTVR